MRLRMVEDGSFCWDLLVEINFTASWGFTSRTKLRISDVYAGFRQNFFKACWTTCQLTSVPDSTIFYFQTFTSWHSFKLLFCTSSTSIFNSDYCFIKLSCWNSSGSKELSVDSTFFNIFFTSKDYSSLSKFLIKPWNLNLSLLKLSYFDEELLFLLIASSTISQISWSYYSRFMGCSCYFYDSSSSSISSWSYPINFIGSSPLIKIFCLSISFLKKWTS